MSYDSKPKFWSFDIHDGIVYKSIDGVDIKTAILVPKSLKPGTKRPVLVHWHGGGFMTGQRLFEPWFALWFMQWAESVGAVVVSPDYRLLPESSSNDMLDDVVDFWSWVHNNLPAEISKATSGAVEVDVADIAVGGESAGGFLSVISALLCPDAGIKAIVCQYGPLDYDLPWYTQPSNRAVLGSPPQEPGKADESIEGYLNRHVRVSSPVIRTESKVEDEWPLCVAYLYAGRFAEALGFHDRIMPMKLLDKAETLPPIWFVHGSQDSVVHQDCTLKFVEKVKKVLPQTPMHVSMESGEHGFDGDIAIEEKWVQDGLSFTSKYWPLGG